MLDCAAINAVQNPGHAYTARSVTFTMRGDFLTGSMPSGRVLYYPYPRVGLKQTPWGQEKLTVFYKSVVAGKWTETSSYGGKWAENFSQAVARDLMANAMLNLESAGFSVLASIHDEVLVEFYECTNIEEHFQVFLDTMVKLPAWAKGLPIAADGWRGGRYKK